VPLQWLRLLRAVSRASRPGALPHDGPVDGGAGCGDAADDDGGVHVLSRNDGDTEGQRWADPLGARSDAFRRFLLSLDLLSLRCLQEATGIVTFCWQRIVGVMSTAATYILELAARGQHHFTTQEAVVALGQSVATVRAALRRLKAKGEIADPHQGFHVIVPPEYRRLGCLPADQFVPQLMQHLGEAYYVALLSAAELHGAAHQRPQNFQVMVRTNRRPIECGAVRVQFVARRDLDRTAVIEKNTPRGPLRVASPEATAFELVGYADHCGGLDNVASVLSELVEAIDPPRLVAAAVLCPVVWVQRLGHLLDLSGHAELGDVLVPHVQKHAHVVAPLVRAKTRTGAQRVERWKLAVNATVEPDL